MILSAFGQELSFTRDERSGYFTCDGALPSWSGFISENSRRGLEGAKVRFILQPTSFEENSTLGPVERYQSALSWLSENERSVSQSAVRGLLELVEVLLQEYGIADEELESVESADDLRSLVDLTLVRVFPHSKGSHPYFGLQFECNWDPEHGCGLMLCGNTVVDMGTSDSAQSFGAISEDGGAA